MHCKKLSGLLKFSQTRSLIVFISLCPSQMVSQVTTGEGSGSSKAHIGKQSVHFFVPFLEFDRRTIQIYHRHWSALFVGYFSHTWPRRAPLRIRKPEVMRLLRVRQAKCSICERAMRNERCDFCEGKSGKSVGNVGKHIN